MGYFFNGKIIYMGLAHHASHFHFLKDKALNRLYAAISISTFGESLIRIFIPIYLYNIGFSIYQILIFFGLVSLYFVILAYPVSKIVSLIGERHAMAISIPFILIYYLGLFYIQEIPILFFILPIFNSLRLTFFDFGFHLNFLQHTERKKRGSQIASISILITIAAFLAPFLGGIIGQHNFWNLFLVSSFFMVIASYILITSKDDYAKIKFSLKGVFKNVISNKNRGNTLSFAGYAIESNIGSIIWPIFLITILGTLSKTGFIISLSLIISVLVFYIMGKITDKFNNKSLLKAGTFLYVLSWIGRIFSDTTNKIIIIDSYHNLSQKIVHLPWSNQSYSLAQKENSFRFIIGREIVFHIARAIAMPILAVIFFINFNPFLISFIVASIASLGYTMIRK